MLMANSHQSLILGCSASIFMHFWPAGLAGSNDQRRPQAQGFRLWHLSDLSMAPSLHYAFDAPLDCFICRHLQCPWNSGYSLLFIQDPQSVAPNMILLAKCLRMSSYFFTPFLWKICHGCGCMS
jgi:hypothetical protein